VEIVVATAVVTAADATNPCFNSKC